MKKGFMVLGIGVLGLIFTGSSVFAVTGTVTGSNVRIRKEASKTSEEISLATKDEKVNVIGEDGDWYKVEFEDVTGYISKAYVDTDYVGSSENTNQATSEENNTNDNTSSLEEENVSSSEENTSNSEENALEISSSIKSGDVLKIENEANVRNLPSFSSRVISSIAVNTEVTVKDVLNNWIKVTDGNVTGWILKIEASGAVSSVEEPTNSSEQTQEPENTSVTETQNKEESETVTSSVGKTGIINVDSAKIRTSPNGTVIDVVDLNDEVEILSEEDDWYKINIGENKGCYIAKRLVTVK